MSPVLVSLTDEKSSPLNRPSIFVGRDRWRVDVRLPGEDVDEVHCELIQHGTGFRLINLSDSGTLVNGQPVSEAVLRDGDELTIASHRLRLSCGPVASVARIEVWSDDSAEEAWATLSQEEPDPDAQPGRSTTDVADNDGEPGIATSGLWQIQLAGLELGPMPWDELKEMVQTGQAQLTDPVRSTGSSEWRPVSEVLELDEVSEANADFATSETGNGLAGEPGESSSTLDSNEPEETPNSSEPVLDGDPQFFVMIDETESGPVPLESLQQLALEYRIGADTLVREEDESEWMAAGSLPIDIPPPVEARGEMPPEETTKPNCEPSSATPDQQLIAKLSWLVLAPFYYLANAIHAILSLSPRTLAIGGVTVVVVGSVLFFWFRGWSQTALTGTLTLDGQPVPAVLITLTGMSTGDSAVGLTDSNGRFSARTLDGDLLPGRYHVTVGPLPGDGSDEGQDDPGGVRIPTKYKSLGMTDLIIEITPESSDYEVDLTARLSGSRFGAER